MYESEFISSEELALLEETVDIHHDDVEMSWETLTAGMAEMLVYCMLRQHWGEIPDDDMATSVRRHCVGQVVRAAKAARGVIGPTVRREKGGRRGS